MTYKHERRTLSIAEAAKVLGIGRNQAYEAARRGEIPTIRIGRRIMGRSAAINSSSMPAASSSKISLAPGITAQRPLGTWQGDDAATVRKRDAQKSKVRSAVEHVFAHQKGPMGLVVRTIGIARAKVKIGLANLAYNMRRVVWLSARAAVA